MVVSACLISSKLRLAALRDASRLGPSNEKTCRLQKTWRLRYHETQSPSDWLSHDMDLEEAWTWFWGQIARTLSGCLAKVLLGFQTRALFQKWICCRDALNAKDVVEWPTSQPWAFGGCCSGRKDGLGWQLVFFTFATRLWCD